ncbi:MAG: dienelactone hydrolase [Acidimicrobiia bacterium]|nr:dienelactone hydrolase [Acidimicrobiia bacterium]
MSAPVSAAGGVLLAPGAGGDPDHHTLVALERALAPLPVRRLEFPHRSGGRRGPPPRAERLVPFIAEQAGAMCAEESIDPASLVLGGRSMGGRVCSLAVADGLPAAGLVLLSYPLHPPRRPGNLRVTHFGRLAVPCLFVSGDRDPFGTPDEFVTHTAAIAGEVTHVWLPGRGHDTRPADDDAVVGAVRSWLEATGG